MLKKWSFENVSLWRGFTLGLATIAIVFIHCYDLNFAAIISSKDVCDFLDYLRDASSWGVDGFLILSGVGLYYSLSKNPPLKTFYKNRFKRVLPTLIIGSAIVYGLCWSITAKGYIHNSLMLGFIGNEGKWFFTLLLLLYILCPLFYKVIKKFNWWGLLALLIIVFGINLTLRLTEVGDFYNTNEVALTRIPSFIVGLMLGRLALEKKEVPRFVPYIFLIVGVTLVIVLYNVVWELYYYRYLRAVIFLCLIVVASYFASRLKNSNGPLRRFITWIGTYSIECYLLFQALYELFKPHFTVKDSSRIIMYFVSFILTLLVGALIKLLVKELSEKMHW